MSKNMDSLSSEEKIVREFIDEWLVTSLKDYKEKTISKMEEYFDRVIENASFTVREKKKINQTIRKYNGDKYIPYREVEKACKGIRYKIISKLRFSKGAIIDTIL